ncbi:MAG: threonylcarbamoyl-AMP synthase [Candidatus Eisenbacteria bacterium]|nr:threonylcarbamoyl-AMP synthase [Candidatus Eisenbacteria bacterium]
MKEIDLTSRGDESMRDRLRPAALAIREGGLVIIPTSTYYGLAADALDPEAVRRVFRAKKRDPGKPLIALVDSVAMASMLTTRIDPRLKELEWRLGSRALTYVLPAAERLPEELTAGGGTIAIRIERNEVVQELLGLAGTPVTGPSANLEGEPPPARFEDAVASLRDHVDVAVRHWPSTTGTASTIVDLTGPEPRVLREGTVSSAEIAGALSPGLS